MGKISIWTGRFIAKTVRYSHTPLAGSSMLWTGIMAPQKCPLYPGVVAGKTIQAGTGYHNVRKMFLAGFTNTFKDV